MKQHSISTTKILQHYTARWNWQKVELELGCSFATLYSLHQTFS